MELIVLGSGCFTPDPGEKRPRNPSGYAVKAGADTLIFDLGFGNVRQLFRAGVDLSSVSHAFFTHRHPDHVGDLPALLFHYRNAGKPLRGRLTLCGPRGFKSFVERLSRAHHPWLRPRGFSLHVQELEEGAVVAGKNWTVRAREVPHSTEALAYRVEQGKSSLCYSGDTGFDPGLASFAKDAGLFLLECSLPDSAKNTNHLRVCDAIRLFEASGAEKGLFTHLSADSFRELKRKMPRNGRAAADLMRVRVR